MKLMKSPLLTCLEDGDLLRKIMVKASVQNCHKVPVDWENTDCPEIWADEKEQVEYYWYEDAGSNLHRVN